MAGMARKKKPAHDQEAAEPAATRVAPVAENVSVDSPINLPEDNKTLFEGLEPPSALEMRSDGLPSLDTGLTPDQKREFLDLIRKEMSVAERAKQLATLARFTDTKRAPVALRAIIEMNVLDGLHEDKPTEATPLFTLPADSKMAVLVQKVDK